MLKQRIPTILGLVLLVFGLAVGIVAVQTTQKFVSLAAQEIAPDDVRVTNLTDQGFTVSWVTQKETIGFLSYGSTRDLGQTAFDDRASGNTSFSSTVHYVTMKGLKVDTHYYFKIGSGKRLFDDRGHAFIHKTAKTPATPPPTASPMYGTVKQADGSPASGVIVYATLQGVTLSALTKNDGNFLLLTNNAHTKDGTGYVALPKVGETIELFVQAGVRGSASATTDGSNSKPIPDIALGAKNLKFAARQQLPEVPLAASPSASVQIASPGASPLPEPTKAPSSATIATEVVDNQLFRENRPTFRGTGTPGSILTITVQSSPQTETVAVQSDGTWEWTPKQPLSPGTHTLTVTPRGGTPVVVQFQIAQNAVATPAAKVQPAGPSSDTSLPNAGEPWQTLALVALGILLIVFGGSGLLCSSRRLTRW